MLVLAAVPLIVSVLLGRAAGTLADRLPGRTAAMVLTTAALASALATGLVLCAVAALGLACLPPLARLGHLSPAALGTRIPVPTPAALLVGLVASGLLGAAAVRAVRSVRGLLRSARMCRQLSGGAAGATGLVVLDGPGADAYALAGLPGRTVVTRPMLQALPPAERRALLAHESAHVEYHHWLYEHLTLLAAAADPVLRPLVPQVRLALERWADDVAADRVGDGRLVASALTRAGRARRLHRPDRLPSGALGAVQMGTTARVAALLSPRPGRRVVRAVTAAVLCAAVASGGCALATGAHAHTLVEWAQTRR